MVAGLAAAAIVGGVAVAGGLFFRDTSRPASVTAALGAFRTEDPHPTGDEGLYLYDTTGGESLDVLNGATHAYPATTTLALTRAACGVRLRWQALTGRSTTWVLCGGGRGTVEQSDDEVHTFFGQTDHTNYACAGVWPSTGPAGARRAFACRSAHGSERGFAVLVGRGAVLVGGTRVDAVHVRTTAQVSGTSHGTETVDWWLAGSAAAPVRIMLTSRTSRKEPIVGTAHYRERAVLRLESLTPLR